MEKFVFDLTYFNEGEEETSQEFDIDSEIDAFEKEWADMEDDEGEEEEEEEPESDSEPEGEHEEAQEDDESDEGDSEGAEPTFDTEKQNRAFRDMRQQLEQEKKYADVIRRIAKENGVSEDKIIENFERKQLEAEARQQNVPVEVLERVKNLENQNKQLQDQTFQEKFNANVDKTKEEFDLTDEDIKGVFAAYKENNWNPKEVSFDQAFKLSNFDKIMERRVQEARQQELEKKRQRRSGAHVPSGKGEPPKPSSATLTDEEHNDILKEMGIEL